ncbi:MAG: alkaline phosphatase family protein [Candidatus Cybelea sp.]
MRGISFGSRLLAIAVAALLVAGCRGAAGAGSSSAIPFRVAQRGEAPIGPLNRGPLDKIKHIVIIIQENRTLNNLFNGYPGATTTKFGYISTSKQKIELQPVTIATRWDLQHNANAFFDGCNGTGKIPGTDCRMNGFNKEYWTCGTPHNPKCPDKYPPYSYVPQDQVKPYFDMARQYVLADEFFASDFDISSFISHQYIIAGLNPNSTVNYPETAWGCPGGPTDKIFKLNPDRKISLMPIAVTCWSPTTLGQELDAKGISWAYYAASVNGVKGVPECGGKGPDAGKGRHGIWSAYQAIKYICYGSGGSGGSGGSDWDNNVISPPQQFITDVQNGNLRAVTWVTPTNINSDHPGNGSLTGPSWVASLVNAVGESPFWDSTAIFIFWDDPGGWYDPVAPKYVDNDGLGFRLPLLIISPYAKQGFVSHTHYEHGSILKFVEDRFGLPRMEASDSRANSPAKYAFDFSKGPRKFVPIKSKYDLDFFLNQPLDTRPPDDN